MKLIILNGPSGIGKSTISMCLHVDMPNSILIDVDELRRSIHEYKERREESHRLAYEKTAEAIEDHLKDGQNVIVDKTILESHILDLLISIGKKHGAEVYEFFLFADKEIVQRRADERGYRPGSLLTRERVGELWEKAYALREQRSEAIFIDTGQMSIEELFEKVKGAVVKA